MSRPLPLVLAQAPEPAGDIDAFAADVRARTAGLPKRPLVVYPELHLCSPDAPAESTSEPLDGPRDKALAEIAGDLGVWLVPGSVHERGPEGDIYNTLPVYSPDGARVTHYRKIFPWRPYEKVTPGDTFTVFDIPGTGRIGLSICYDAWFPEVARHLAWMGAELVLNPTRTGTSDRAQEVVLARANAIANQVFVAGVNCAGPVGAGRSLIVDPQGTVRVAAPAAEEITLTDVVNLDDAALVRRHGTSALNRLWQQFRPGDTPLPLPMYEGRIDPLRWTGDALADPAADPDTAA